MTGIVVPGPFTKLAMAVWPFIFLPPGMYSRYARGEATIDDQAVMLHERTHIAREWAMNPLVFGVRYLRDKKFRLREELAAIREEMQFRRAHGSVYDIERKARHFSSALYGYLLPYEDAVRVLTELWTERYTA